MINTVILEGNLTRDVDLRYVGQNNTAIARMGMASNRQYGENEETIFFDVDVWGRQAETVAEYLGKGSRVLVEGRLSYDSWETEEGQKRSKIYVTASRVNFLNGVKSDGGSTQSKNTNNSNEKPESEFADDSDVPF